MLPIRNTLNIKIQIKWRWKIIEKTVPYKKLSTRIKHFFKKIILHYWICYLDKCVLLKIPYFYDLRISHDVFWSYSSSCLPLIPPRYNPSFPICFQLHIPLYFFKQLTESKFCWPCTPRCETIKMVKLPGIPPLK